MRRAWVHPFDAAAGRRAVTLVAELGYGFDLRRGDDASAVAAALDEAPDPTVILLCVGDEATLDHAEAFAGELRNIAGLAGVPTLLVLAEPLPTAAGDELVVLPASAAELGLRIARAQSRLGQSVAGEQVASGDLTLDLVTYEATAGDRPLSLTHMEFELLRFLATHPGRAFSRAALLERVWGYDYLGATRTVDVHVRRLRMKLGDERAERIQTVRSVGYRFDG